MSKYKIEFLPQANQDLEDIADYLSQYYLSTVEKFRKALTDKIAIIKDNPFIYPKSLFSSKYRRAIIKEYILYYAIDEEKQIITVYMIIHSSRDIEKYISKLQNYIEE